MPSLSKSGDAVEGGDNRGQSSVDGRSQRLMQDSSSQEVLVEVGNGRVEGGPDSRVGVKGAHGVADREEKLANHIVDEILAHAEVLADDVAVAGVNNGLGKSSHVLDGVTILVEHVICALFDAVLANLDTLDSRV